MYNIYIINLFTFFKGVYLIVRVYRCYTLQLITISNLDIIIYNNIIILKTLEEMRKH